MSRQKWLTGLILVCLANGPLGQVAFAQTLNAKNNYLLHCSGCHRGDGTGSRTGGVPSLSLVKAFTSDAEGRKYLMHVPGIAYSGLSNKEIAAVVNYVVVRLGQPDVPFQLFTAEEVDHLRAVNIDDIVGYRRALAKRYATEGKLVADYPWP